MDETREWWSYDTVAETYDRLAVPYVFSQPATDLVSMLRLPRGARALDVGAGTCVAALALQSAEPEGLIVALDSSLGMLRAARQKGLPRLVAGLADRLPFPDAVFDGVLGNFVLSHVPSYQTALSEMVRVLRTGGSLGFSAWGTAQSEFRVLWQATAESFVKKEELGRGLRRALPWEEWFSDAGHMEEALHEVGLERIEVDRRAYTISVSVDDFLSLRELTFQARLMIELLSTARWESFRENVRKEFHNRCHGLIEDPREAYLAIGVKPRS
jgi:ubiquinone/menaquinone biosynthesis C-methylase UbiE